MTSTQPPKVTCLACREFAHGRYLELAAYVEQVSRTPGTPRDISARATSAAGRYRALAEQFGDPQQPLEGPART